MGGNLWNAEMWWILAAVAIIDPPVVLKARELPIVEGRSVDEISVWVYRNGKRETIPYQVDEVDKTGNFLTRYIMEEGVPRKRREGWKFGRFNGEDELVFMAGDCGEKKPYSDLRNIYEVEVDTGERKCYFYISEGKGGSRGYISYNPKDDIFSSEFFSYGSINSSSPAVLNYFIMKGLPKSLIKNFHLHLFISSMGGKIKFERTEEDISADVAGFTDGPVRLVKLMNYRMRIAKGIQTPKAVRTSIAYRNCGSFPTEVNIPVKPSLLVDEAFLKLSFDFNDIVERFILSLPDGEEIPLKMIRAGEEKVLSSAREILFKGKEGELLSELILPEVITEKIRGSIMISRKEEGFVLSWKLFGFEGLEKGNYSFLFRLCVFSRDTLKVDDLKTRVIPLSSQGN